MKTKQAWIIEGNVMTTKTSERHEIITKESEKAK